MVNWCIEGDQVLLEDSELFMSLLDLAEGVYDDLLTEQQNFKLELSGKSGLMSVNWTLHTR